MILNRKGGIIGFFFQIAVVIVMWAIFLADLFTWVGENALAGGNLSGIEAFIYTNLNVVIFIGIVIVLGAVNVFGGGQ